MRNYDIIVSLGGNCSAAIQLQARGMRFYSLPFDWLRMNDESSLYYLSRSFPTRLCDFCQKENLEPLSREGRSGTAPYLYRDKTSGYEFLHHFHKPAETEVGYREMRKTLQRRINRMFAMIERANAVLFILAADFSYSDDAIRTLMDALRGMYPEKKVDFALLRFCSQFTESNVLARRWPWNDVAYGAEYARRITHYDLDYTSVEWSFLDEIGITGFDHARPEGWNRILYRIWKHLSRRLNRSGFGCKGIMFT